MKANKDKHHLIVSGKCRKTVSVCDVEIRSSDCEKLLAVKIDSIPNFEEQFCNILTKASRKISCFVRSHALHELI